MQNLWLPSFEPGWPSIQAKISLKLEQDVGGIFATYPSPEFASLEISELISIWSKSTRTQDNVLFCVGRNQVWVVLMSWKCCSGCDCTQKLSNCWDSAGCAAGRGMGWSLCQQLKRTEHGGGWIYISCHSSDTGGWWGYIELSCWFRMKNMIFLSAKAHEQE